MSPDGASHKTRVLALLAILNLCACTEPSILHECRPGKAMTPDCRFVNPEDLALLPDGKTLVVSQLGDIDADIPGNLALYDTRTRRLQIAFTGEAEAASATPLLGDPTCEKPPGQHFFPHGIDLETMPNGELRLLAVNHGSRESVEFFSVRQQPNGFTIQWRGCATAPQDGYFNDVIALRDGGFMVTHMMLKSGNPAWQAFKGMVLGLDTGFVYEWQPIDGFLRLPGSAAGMPNGIEKSPDERFIYMSAYFHDEIRKIHRFTGEVAGKAGISRPDNITWGWDDRLLVASHTAGFVEQVSCEPEKSAACGTAFEIVALEPETMETSVLLRQEGEPFGAASVALPVGDRLFLGTHAGNRLASMAIDSLNGSR